MPLPLTRRQLSITAKLPRVPRMAPTMDMAPTRIFTGVA